MAMQLIETGAAVTAQPTSLPVGRKQLLVILPICNILLSVSLDSGDHPALQFKPCYFKCYWLATASVCCRCTQWAVQALSVPCLPLESLIITMVHTSWSLALKTALNVVLTLST